MVNFYPFSVIYECMLLLFCLYPPHLLSFEEKKKNDYKPPYHRKENCTMHVTGTAAQTTLCPYNNYYFTTQ